MRIEQHIVAAWARQLEAKLIQEAIAALKQMRGGMLSGDAGLGNVWEEICVQVQDEASLFWSAYAETIDNHFSGHIASLEPDECLALWAVTNEGWDYIYDQREENHGVCDVPVSNLAIVQHLKAALLAAAAEFSNARIKNFLRRHETDFDELDDDDSSTEAGTSDFEPGVQEPVYFVISRQEVESGDTGSAMEFLRSLVPTDDPHHAWTFKSRLALHISGYDQDPRELFEIPEVGQYLKALDEEWPFWFFFLNQADESLKVLAMCLCSSTDVAPGQTRIDPKDFARFWERGVDAMGFLFQTYEYPSADGEALLMQIARFFANGQSPMDPDNCLGSAS